jgi:hypothetical protein
MSIPSKVEGYQVVSSHVSHASGVQDMLDMSRMSVEGLFEAQGESAPLAAALAIEKPKLFSKQMFPLFSVCFLAYLSIISLTSALTLDSCINGFDAYDRGFCC